MELGAGGGGRAGEASRIGERLEVAAPMVEHPPQVDVGAEQLGGFPVGQELHRSAPRRPLARPVLQEGEAAPALGALDVARPHRIAADAVPLDQMKDEIAGGVGHLVDAPPVLRAM